jgi:hypothetical protein
VTITKSKAPRLLLALAATAYQPRIALAQASATSWLDAPKPANWNKPGLTLPAAPESPYDIDPKCQAQARPPELGPPELGEDTRLHEKGWDLIGAYQGGWILLVIAANFGYDGMCRPNAFQYFVFSRGVFIGTLSPRLMASRTDGALSRVALEFLNGKKLLVADYLRYADTDPLCCASATTKVDFELAPDGSVVRPSTPFTTPNH